MLTVGAVKKKTRMVSKKSSPVYEGSLHFVLTPQVVLLSLPLSPPSAPRFSLLLLPPPPPLSPPSFSENIMYTRQCHRLLCLMIIIIIIITSFSVISYPQDLYGTLCIKVMHQGIGGKVELSVVQVRISDVVEHCLNPPSAIPQPTTPTTATSTTVASVQKGEILSCFVLVHPQSFHNPS